MYDVCAPLVPTLADMFLKYNKMRLSSSADAETEAASGFITGVVRRLSSRLFFVVSRAIRLPALGYADGLRLLCCTLLYLLGEGTGEANHAMYSTPCQRGGCLSVCR